MGWDTSTSGAKRTGADGASMIYPGGKCHPVMAKYKSVVVDVNAWLRSVLPRSLGTDTTPLQATQRIFWSSLFKKKDADDKFSEQTMPDLQYALFAFDDGALLPEMRHIFHASKRYKKAVAAPRAHERRCPEDGRNYPRDEYPIDDDLIDSITMTNMPGKWICVWNNPRAKNKLWAVLVECIKQVIREGVQTNPHTIYIVDDNHGERWVHPVTDAADPNLVENGMPPLWYGEADLKALHWGLYFDGCDVGPVAFATNDWDSVLTMLLHKAPIDIILGSVLVHDDEDGTPFVFDPLRVALRDPKKEWDCPGKRAFEIIHMDVLHTKYPEYDRRCELLMLLMCNGGVDYCDGLARFGYSEKVVESITDGFREGRTKPWITTLVDPDDPGRRSMEFNLGVFFDALLLEGPRNVKTAKTAPTKDFNKEVHDILFCVRYFGGWDSQTSPAGPPVPPYATQQLVAYDTVKTMAGIYNKPSAVRHAFIIVEEHPVDDLELWPHPLLYSYAPQQVDAIVALLGGPDFFAESGAKVYEIEQDDGGSVDDDDANPLDFSRLEGGGAAPPARHVVSPVLVSAEDMDENENEYDTDDSFIDDSAMKE
jgi:hypothetical protein